MTKLTDEEHQAAVDATAKKITRQKKGFPEDQPSQRGDDPVVDAVYDAISRQMKKKT